MRKIYLFVCGLMVPALMLVYLSLYNRSVYNSVTRLSEHSQLLLMRNSTVSSDSRRSCRYYRAHRTENVTIPLPCLDDLSVYANSVPDNKPIGDMEFETCALVSTSGHMLNGSRGAEIDSADTVIRMNIAPLASFEKDVGNRTDARVVSHNSSWKIKQLAHPRFLMVWGPPAEIKGTPGHEGGAYRRAREFAEAYGDVVEAAYVITETEMERSDSVWSQLTHRNRLKEGSYISTGFFSMVFALNMCERVKVYGISPEDYCRLHRHTTIPYHYYGEGWNQKNECSYILGHQNKKGRGSHRFLSEKKVFGDWTKTFKLTFHQPDWGN